jgi:hypothetical protein
LPVALKSWSPRASGRNTGILPVSSAKLPSLANRKQARMLALPGQAGSLSYFPAASPLGQLCGESASDCLPLRRSPLEFLPYG